MNIGRDINGIAHVVALSGGKDSTCLALALKEREPKMYTYVCTPTGDELPEMIAHWQGLGRVLNAPILPVTGGVSLSGLIARWNALPNDRMRWCTRVLKLEPYYRFLDEIVPCVSYVGLRADEEGRAGMEFPEGGQIQVRFPFREWGWGLSEVWAYLEQRPGHTNATMAADVPMRTDCARCYHQTLGEWWHLWRSHPDIYADAEQEEAAVTEARGRQHTFRNDTRDSWPASLAELRKRFEAGEIPPRTAQQPDMFLGLQRRKKMCRVCSL